MLLVGHLIFIRLREAFEWAGFQRSKDYDVQGKKNNSKEQQD